MFLSRNKKNNVYPCKPQFYYIKVGTKGVKTIQACFRDAKFVWLSLDVSKSTDSMVNTVDPDQTVPIGAV